MSSEEACAPNTAARRERAAGDDEIGGAKRLRVDPLQGLVAALEALESGSPSVGDAATVSRGSASDLVRDDLHDDASTCEYLAVQSARAGSSVGTEGDATLTRASPSTATSLHSMFALMSFIPSRDAFEEQLAAIVRTRGAMLPHTSAAGSRRLGTLVLDLDETLVHSSLVPTLDADYSFVVPLAGDNNALTVFTKKRPYCDWFLRRVAMQFEIVVFTASKQVYADRVIDYLDPQGTLVQHRVYRDHCVEWQCNYLKDLAVLGRDLARTAIVDNSPLAFSLQMDNGIPIESWFADPRDDHLVRVEALLRQLALTEGDWRPLLRGRFGLRARVEAAIACR